jgi:hypothetical protein
MNELEFERSLSDWVREGRSSPSSAILPSVAEHAQRHSNQPWWQRARTAIHPLGSHAAGSASGPVPSRHAVGLATVAVAALAVLVAVPLIVNGPRPQAEEASALVLASAEPTTSSDTSAPSPAPSFQVGFPDGGGSTGSVWLEQAEGEVDHYITLHPDGTLVERIKDLGSPVGIGLWRPDGQGGLSSVTVFPDADPVRHQIRGLSTYRADWTLNGDAESGGLTWTAKMRSSDGTSLPDASGRSSLTRLHRLELPPEAIHDLPAEPDWEPILGPVAMGAGSGSVAMLTPVGSECEGLDLPGSLVIHGDGTSFITSPKGSGVGLWIPSGPDTRALTGWAQLPDIRAAEGWVGQLRHRVLVAGTTEAFEGPLPAAPRRLVGIDGAPLSPPDADLWPAEGTVWLEPTELGTGITAYLTDGTLIARDPRHGVGAGYWQPLDDDTIASWISFPSSPGSGRQMRSEANVAPDGESMSMTSILKDNGTGSEEARTATATRLHLEP